MASLPPPRRQRNYRLIAIYALACWGLYDLSGRAIHVVGRVFDPFALNYRLGWYQLRAVQTDGKFIAVGAFDETREGLLVASDGSCVQLANAATKTLLSEFEQGYGSLVLHGPHIIDFHCDAGWPTGAVSLRERAIQLGSTTKCTEQVIP
jgi:hypothetical protein